MTALQPCAIFDVDGTLADVSGIRHYITADAQRKNFEKFHAASIMVHPHEPVAELARVLYASGMPVLVVTARMERWRYITSTWLQKWRIPHDALLMRPDGDGRRDVEIKREILTRIRERYTPALAVDDNPAIVALWREEQIPVVEWPGWDHDRLTEGATR